MDALQFAAENYVRHLTDSLQSLQGSCLMALDPRVAALALHRFGFGPRAGTIAAIASDPQGALLADLDRPDAGRVADAGLMTSGAANRMVFEYNAAQQAKQRLESKRKEAEKEAEKDAAKRAAENPAMVPGGDAQMAAMENAKPDAKSTDAKCADAKCADTKPAGAKPADAAPPRPPETPAAQNFFREAEAHYRAGSLAEIGFVERLVWFWSNHFCVNADDTVMAGAYEREAIRPHVLGKFGDLLLAAESHPAMLVYLNNTTSMGPNSVAGINRSRGLNENLGREILELHTLGVRTGYSQDDVTSFAKTITGWTIRNTADDPDHGGEFLFHPRLHEPGAQTVLGKAYRDTGVEQARAVLADLARHPATALHVALKLARHFVADEPPPSLVETLRRTFVETGGDLWEVSKALVRAPESWAPEQRKLKRPSEWMTAWLRAAGFPGDPRVVTRTLNRLGEPLWRPPAPKGFPDTEADWIDGIAHRLDTANAIAQNANVADRVDPKAVLETALGPLASAETRSAVARAETKQQAITLVLMAPEFQRR
jgi:uncharacterized protein (DUF1800 family)